MHQNALTQLHQITTLSAVRETPPKKEKPMSKETRTETTAPAAPLAPLFQLWRTALDEGERHADQWSQHAGAQLEEATRMAKALGAQMMTAARRTVDGIERATVETAAGAAQWTKSFGRSAA
jgi:hypothetical protein